MNANRNLLNLNRVLESRGNGEFPEHSEWFRGLLSGVSESSGVSALRQCFTVAIARILFFRHSEAAKLETR